MAKTVLMEEFHVTVRMPVGLSKIRYSAVVRTLRSQRFQTRLRQAVGNVIRSHSTLKSVAFSISR